MEKEIFEYIKAKQWCNQAKKDIKIQKQIHSIEYVGVAAKEPLPSASPSYIGAFEKISIEEKIEMMQCDSEVDSNNQKSFCNVLRQR